MHWSEAGGGGGGVETAHVTCTLQVFNSFPLSSCHEVSFSVTHVSHIQGSLISIVSLIGINLFFPSSPCLVFSGPLYFRGVYFLLRHYFALNQLPRLFNDI